MQSVTFLKIFLLLLLQENVAISKWS